jgi:hypothetical protein
MCRYFKFKLNPCENGFTEFKSTIYNFGSPKRQVDDVYFAFSSVVHLNSYNVHLHKLGQFGLFCRFLF